MAAEIVGVSVVPHSISPELRYQLPHDPDLAARLQLFIKGPAMPGKFQGRTPAELLASQDWAWHDLATAVPVPDDALTVWNINGKSSRWGVGNSFSIEADGLPATLLDIEQPQVWISAITFLSSTGSVQPDTVIVHFSNESAEPLHISSLRFWLPKDPDNWQTLFPQQTVATSATVPPHD